MYALADCNSFYASCEQIYRPELRGKPVVVLSNNDGVIVARTREAKQLGIPDITPYFKIASLLKRHRVTVFSSNYELYADTSSRVINSLSQLTPNLDVYSIDEAFINLENLESKPQALGKHICQTIWQHQRIPMSLGIAPTKTLSKVANHLAKQHPSLHGVCVLDNLAIIRRGLSSLPITKIWGVGRRTATKLNLLGIETAEQLRTQNPKQLRKRFNIHMERLIMELNGEPCRELDDTVEAKKQIFCSRMFGSRVESLVELQQAAALYASRACEKLRQQNSLAGAITVYIQTSRYDRQPLFKNSLVRLPYPSNDSCFIAHLVREAVAKIYRSGYLYSKAGVGLLDIINDSHLQYRLFDQAQQSPKSHRLMETLDNINKRWNNGVFLASSGTRRNWYMSRQLKSPNYTTNWVQLPTINMK